MHRLSSSPMLALAFVCLLAATVSAQTSNYTVCLANIKSMFSQDPKTEYPQGYEMIDFSGKAINDLGNYDECLDLGEVANYCLMEAFVKTEITRVEVPIYIGACVPSSCSESDLNIIFQQRLHGVNTSAIPVLNQIDFTMATFHCHHEPEALSGAAIFTLVLCGLILMIVVAGTVVEGIDSHRASEELRTVSVSGTFKQYQAIPEQDPASRSDAILNQVHTHNPINDEGKRAKKQSTFIVFLKCFAIQPNLRFLFQDNTQNGASPLASLNGLRVTMMGWIILGHTLTYSMYPVGYDNTLRVADKIIKEMSFQVVPAAEFAVDVFFYISGFLVMFMLLKELNQRKGRISWPLFYFHRYWRLTPVFAFIMLFYTTVTPHMIDGPFAYQYRPAKTDLCVQHWWTNLLYINNFVPQSSGAQCMGWTWFLANDMQFYLITPIFALLFRKSRKAGWALLLLVAFGSLLSNWLLAAHYNLSPMDPNDDKFNSILYNKPWTRILAYLQGIAVAFLLQYEDRDFLSNRIVRYVGYLAAFAVTFCPVYLTTSFWDNNGQWPRIDNLMYITFSRLGFVLGVMFVMYALYKAHGYLLRKVLSAWMWVFLARLTYTAYLTHPIIIFVQYFNATRVFNLDVFFATQHYITNIVLAYSIGLIFHLAIEKPTANLERLLLPHKKN